MSNHLTNVDVNPTKLKSGSEASASVEYESDTGGPLQLSSGAGFTITPSSKTLRATPSAVESVAFTITRGAATTKSCRVIFTFFESKCELLVEVT
jgi:hypothetical protein